jgi:hypothetical protein
MTRIPSSYLIANHDICKKKLVKNEASLRLSQKNLRKKKRPQSEIAGVFNAITQPAGINVPQPERLCLFFKIKMFL